MFFAYIIFRRFLELFVAEAALSALYSLLFATGFIPSTMATIAFGATIPLLIFFIFNIKMMRSCYMSLGDETMYAVLNLLANAAFIATNVIFYFAANNVIYTWFFGIFKATHYFSLTGILFSAGIFQLISLLLIFAAPFGLHPTGIGDQTFEME